MFFIIMYFSDRSYDVVISAGIINDMFLKNLGHNPAHVGTKHSRDT